MTEDEIILTAVLNCSRADLYFKRKNITSEQAAEIERIRARRKAGEPLQYLIGFTEFMGLRIHVNEHVLIPRPETEYLVEKILKRIDDKDQSINILDLCTGSGNIAVSLACFLPNASINAVDISADALNVAVQNSKILNLDKKITFFNSCLHNFIYYINKDKFDLIVSNPPYITTKQMNSLPEDVRAEPSLALDGGMDGLDFYREIFAGMQNILNSDGMIALEIGEDQRMPLECIIRNYPIYSNISFEKDLAGKDRYVFAVYKP